MTSPKIAKYSLADLKNTTDDALPNYLNSLSFKQNHTLTDVRLALGYAAVSIAAVLFYADWKLGWDKTKDATLAAVVGYFVINTALTGWIWLVEKGVVYKGEREGTVISIASSTKKHTPIYYINVTQTSSISEAPPLKLEARFSRWFDQDGTFVAKPFQQWLASQVPAIGHADPKSKQYGIEGAGTGSGDVQVAEAVVIQESSPASATSPGGRARKAKKG